VKAVVLAGGAGMGLRPLTLDRPAALLPVANRPIVEHLLEHLVRHGVTEVTLALHHCPYPVEVHLGDGTRLGLALRYALERRPLGTGGAARRAAAGFAEPWLLAFGTALTAVDLSRVLAAHTLRSAAATLVLAPAAGEGVLGLDRAGMLVLNGARGPARFRFAGLAIVEPHALPLLAPGEPADLLDDWVPRLLASGLVVHGYVTTEPGLLVRSLPDLAAANRLALGGDLPGLVLPGFEVRPGIRLSRGALVHPTARLVPPVLVGANTFVGRGATLEATVVGEEVIVESHATLRAAVVLARTHVGRALRLDGAVVDRDRVGRPESGAWATIRDPRLLGDTRTPLRARPAGLAGRLLATGLLAASAPLWVPLLLGVAVETGGRPLRARQVIGARGRPARLPRIAVAGPVGRLLRRLGLVRAPQLWSVARGDLAWVGTCPRAPEGPGAPSAPADLPAAAPGLFTLAGLAPAPLRPQDRLALDRLYAATRTRRGDLRLLAAALRRRVGPGPRPAAGAHRGRPRPLRVRQ